jgi:TRIAD3 protein (E3 ubiquitin-protein ligase RNF216)
VLEIIPDVQLDHLIALLIEHMPSAQDQVVDVVVSALLEDPKYPRTEKKGKRRWMEQNSDGSGERSTTIDYADKRRKFIGGPVYDQLAQVCPSRATFCLTTEYLAGSTMR